MIRLFSDLHLEMGLSAINKCVAICKKKPTKYIILAGDITDFNNKKNLTELIESLEPFTKVENIIYVLGNHEYHKNMNKCQEETLWHYKKLCKSIGINLLENEKLLTDDYLFYGTTLWTKNKSVDIREVHENSVSLLEKFLLRSERSERPIVVISHHIPSFSLIDKKYKNEESSSRSIYHSFASNLDHLIKSPIDYWVYGHTHTPNKKIINGTKLFCNPHGYPHKNNYEYYEDCVINESRPL